MGSLSKILVFVLNFFLILEENLSHSSVCGNSKLDIHYPFEFMHEAQPNCSYFSLSCNTNQATVIMNFPQSGDFHVQNIDYRKRTIQLFDPEKCLIRKLMNLSLLFSPLEAKWYENYTFYMCPRGSRFLDYDVNPIECLSNSRTFMVATRKFSQGFMKAYGCRGVGSWLLPVSWRGQFEADASYDLLLTWNTTVYKHCRQSENLVSDKSEAKPIARIVGIAVSLPVLIIMALTCFSVFCLHILNMFAERYDENEAGEGPPIPTATPIHAIENGDRKTCSICLENYGSADELRLIIKCGHYCFHASCIQQWLGKNSTCPVCRTSLCHVDL